MKETDIAIPFTEEDVKKYLDDMIDFWRENRDSGLSGERRMAECYIDAYQCVRKNLFGELKE